MTSPGHLWRNHIDDLAADHLYWRRQTLAQHQPGMDQLGEDAVREAHLDALRDLAALWPQYGIDL